jgi:hypothetical protein
MLLVLQTPAWQQAATAAAATADNVVRVHQFWPSPESVLRDLRSKDEALHLKALERAGVPEAIRVRPSGPATPDQVELRYAALGEDDTQQAILIVQVLDIVVAVVAVPKRGAWERIGLIDCWCKYENEPMDEFVKVVRAHDSKYELVGRNSSGGTGVYSQIETHYRVYRGELKPVLSFLSSYVLFPQGAAQPSFKIQGSWFIGDTLVTGEGGYIDNADLDLI